MRRALAAAALLLATACTTDSEPPPPATTTTTASTPATTASTTATTSPPTRPAPPTFNGQDFYTPPSPLPPGAPGTVIWVQTAHTTTYRAWRVLYHSRSRTGGDVAVSGALLTPTTPPPPGGYPVLAWAHGTTGLADECAPSRAAAPDPTVGILLQNGFAIAGTDYQGLGTPGLHHYVVGAELGHDVLDMVRAARSIVPLADVTIIGHSQGGHAALWAAELAATYAPELPVVGTVSAAPGANLRGLADALPGGAYPGYLVVALVGLADSYPDQRLDRALTPAGRALADVARTRCADDVLRQAGSGTGLVTPGLADTEPWRTVLQENTPGRAPAKAPVLIIQGSADRVVPASTVQELVPRLCAAGTKVDLRVYANADHVSVWQPAGAAVVEWVQARRAGAPVTRSSC